MTPRLSSAARIAAARLDWIVPQWPAPRSVEAFVTTRNARDDAGAPVPFDPGGHLPPQDPRAAAAVRADRERLARFLPGRPVWLEQVHGATVVSIDGRAGACDQLVGGRDERESKAVPSDADAAPRADAAVTRRPGVVLAIRAADCLPVLFCNHEGTAVGAAHAGWRGLAAGVLENTVAAFGCDPGDVLAWLGPAIGRDAFEVGPEVREEFTKHDSDAVAAFTQGHADRWHADLEALARMRLARAGVDAMFGGALCTYTDAARFYSWRRNLGTGRMAALIWIRDDHTADHTALSATAGAAR